MNLLIPYFVIYVGSALLAGGLGYWALARTEMRAQRLFGILMIALALWSIVAASALLVPDRWLQFRLQQLWTSTGLSVVLLWILFTTRYTHRSIRASHVVRVFSGVFILLLITALTFPFHDLYYTSITVHQSPFPHVSTTPGPIRILAIGYLTGGIILGTYYLGSLFQNSRPQLGAPTIILAVAVLLGFIPFVASELNATPVSTYNHTTFGVSVFILGVSYSVYRHSFYDLAPIGRSTLIDVVDDPMVVLDTELRLVDYNPAARRIVSDLTDESIGTPLQEMHPKLATLVADSTDCCNCLRSDRPTADGRSGNDVRQSVSGRTEETELTTPVAGTPRTFSVLVSDITVASDSEGYVLFLRDITTLRNRERELQRQNERLDQFASTVSHDLRNPLNVAKGRLELAQKDSESEHLAPIENAHERMEVLIDDLLTLARTGQAVEDPDLVALADVASDAWDHTDIDDCTLNSSIPAATQIKADRDRLLHVFENLYRNAADHNDPPLTVRVGMITDSDPSTDNGQRTGFFVEDNGDGIPEEQRENIFDHGFTTASNGTGLGLSIVKDIVEAHEWNIRLAHGADGGARFEITGIDVDR